MNNNCEEHLHIRSELTAENANSNRESVNSFLVEVEYNNDISESLRKEINDRFIRSKINKTYKFPRLSPSELRLKPSIYKFSLVRKKKTSIKNREKSQSPYSWTFAKSQKSKTPVKNEGYANSRTPVPNKMSSKLNKSHRLPNITKNKTELKSIVKLSYLVKNNLKK